MNKLQFFKSLKTIESTELYSLRSFAEAAKQIDSKLTYRTIRARLRSPKLAHLFTTVGKDIGFEPRALVVVVSIALKDAMQVIDVTATGAASMAVDAANSTLKQCLLETRALSSGSAVIANNVHTFPLRHLIPATNNMAQVNNAAVKLSAKTEPTEMKFLTRLDNGFHDWHDQPEQGCQEVAFIHFILSSFQRTVKSGRALSTSLLCEAKDILMQTHWHTMPQEWKVQDIPVRVMDYFFCLDPMSYGPVHTKYLVEVCQLVLETIKSIDKDALDDDLVAQLLEEAKVLASVVADKVEAKSAKVTHFRTFANAKLKNVFARAKFEGEMLESITSEIVLFSDVARRVWNTLEWERRDINKCDFDEFLDTKLVPLYWKLPRQWRMDTAEDVPEDYRNHFEDHGRLVYFLGQYPIRMSALPYACKLVIDAIKGLGYDVWEETIEEVMREACALAGAKMETKEQIEAQAVKSLHPVTAAYSADKQTKAMIEERVDFVSWQPYMLEGRLLATTNGLVRVNNVIDNMAMFYIANELDLVEAKQTVLKSEQFKRWTGYVATEFVAISASSLPNFTAALVHELEAKGKRINYVALTTFMQEVLTAATCCITGEYYRLSTNEVINACTNFSVQGCSPMALTRRDELVNKFMVQWEDGCKLFPNDVKDLERCLDLIEATVNAQEVEEEVAKEAEHGVEWSASSGDFGQVPYEEYIDFSIDPREEARLERELGISDEDKDMGFVYDPEHGVFPFNLVDDNGEPIAHLPGQELVVPSTEQATA